MNVLIVPDVHGRSFWREPFLKKDKFDKVIFLGDYTDPYYGEATDEDALQVLKDIIQFKKDNFDKCILLIGNHDCPYIWKEYGAALGSYWCRHDYQNHKEISKLFNDNIDLFQIAWECDNKKYGKVLFTHAGVTSSYEKICGLTAEGINNFFLNESTNNIPNVAGLAGVSYLRGGNLKEGSPVWADVNEHIMNQIPQVFQIFGHTYSTKPVIMEHFAMLDIGKKCYLLSDSGIKEL